MSLLAKIYRKILSISRLDSVLGELSTYKTISFGYGHLRSALLRRPIAKRRKLIPWYSYAAIDYLNSIDTSSFSVLEYGGGNSSFWWAERCKHLTTIESEKDWFQVLLGLGKNHSNLDFQLYMEKDLYTGAINSISPNVVIIDGLYRADCATKVLELGSSQLEALQIVIFDNANWFPSAIKRLTDGLGDFHRVDFSSLGPIVAFPTTTSLFLRTNNSKVVLTDAQIHPTAALPFVHPEDY